MIASVLSLTGEVQPEMASLTLGSMNFPKQASVNEPEMIRRLAEAMVMGLPAAATWAAAGIGRFQFRMNTLAIAMGGNVRIGLEDNLFFDEEKKRPATNAGLVERISRVAVSLERECATPRDAREMIGLASR